MNIYKIRVIRWYVFTPKDPNWEQGTIVELPPSELGPTAWHEIAAGKLEVIRPVVQGAIKSMEEKNKRRVIYCYKCKDYTIVNQVGTLLQCKACDTTLSRLMGSQEYAELEKKIKAFQEAHQFGTYDDIVTGIYGGSIS